MKRTHNNLTENKFRAIEKGGPGGVRPPPPPTPPPPPPPPPPFPGAKIFFPRKIRKHKIFTCEEHLILWFIY